MAELNGKEILFNPQINMSGGSSNYNELDNIPVINQDLTANGFTPVKGTYYRHTGTGGGTIAPVNPIAVGDTISKLYFDTTKEVDFSKFIYDQPFADDIPTGVAMLLSSQQNVNILTANDLSVAGVSGFVLMLMEKTSQTSADVKQTFLYASEALPDLGVSQAGWQSGVSLDLLQENIISAVNQQDVWGAYISKDGQWTSGGSAYTTGAIYYYNGTEYKAITGETKTPDYNQIENIPVINQDLTASGFTPVANTYYRHTGATTDTFTQGIIYLYDTTYHKLGESGGTTLNKYTTFVGDNVVELTTEQLTLISKILLNAKGNACITAQGTLEGRSGISWMVNYSIYPFSPNPDMLYFTATCHSSDYKKTYSWYFWIQNNAIRYDVGKCIAISDDDGTISFIDKSSNILKRVSIVYYNDVEIT